MVDEDNAMLSSPLLDRSKDVQPKNEIIEEEGSTNQFFGIILIEGKLMGKTRLSVIIVRNY